MLHALLVTFALLSSPLECCGGCGGFAFLGPRTCAPSPMPIMSIVPPTPNIPAILRLDQYAPSLRWALVILAPRPISSVMAATLHADAQAKP